VDEAGEFDAGDVAGGAVDAFEVPDGFGSEKGVRSWEGMQRRKWFDTYGLG
jgi:hypothetical protein